MAGARAGRGADRGGTPPPRRWRLRGALRATAGLVVLLAAVSGCSDSSEEPADAGGEAGHEPSDPCGGLDEAPEFLVELPRVERRVWVVVSASAEDRYAEISSVLELEGPGDLGHGIGFSTSAAVIELAEHPEGDGQIDVALRRLEDAGFGSADYAVVDPADCDL